MKKNFTLVFLFLSVQFAFAQQNKFSKIYFDNSLYFSANAMAKSTDGGLIVTGIYNYTSAVMKIDSSGSVVWAKIIGTSQNESVNSVIRTADSCYVMAGKTFDNISATTDMQITKMDDSGNVLWSKTVVLPDYQEIYGLAQSFDNGFIVTGTESYSAPTWNKILVAKFDSLAEVEWIKRYDAGNNSNYGHSVKPTADGGYAVAGYFVNYPPFEAYGLLMKISNLGDIQWVNNYSDISSQIYFTGSDVQVGQDGIYSYYISPTDQAIVKTDYNGNDIWKETISGSLSGGSFLNMVSSKMQLLDNGSLVFATGTRGMNNQSTIISIDTAGNFNWSQYIYNNAHDILQADDNGFFILGNGPLFGVRSSSVTNDHVGIIKSDSLGNADLCTSPNTTISVNHGTIIQSTYSVNEIFISGVSTSLALIPSTMVISEMTSCVDIIGAVDNLSDNSIYIYPNPSSATVKIFLPDINGSVFCEILDLTGKTVLRNNHILTSDKLISLDHHLEQGIYTIMITPADNIKRTAKLIVE